MPLRSLVQGRRLAKLVPRPTNPKMLRIIVKLGRLLLPCAGATALLGCPLYPDECDGSRDCASGYYCDSFTNRCERAADALECVRPSQCEPGETCTPERRCRPGSCDFHGCVRGYRCEVVDSAHACVLGVDVSDAGRVDAGPEGAGPADAGAPRDAGAEPTDAGGRDASVDASP